MIIVKSISNSMLNLLNQNFKSLYDKYFKLVNNNDT